MEDNFDKLDEFFRQNLSDHTPEPGFNVPSDDLFDSAIAVVKNHKKTPRRIWPWLLLAGAIALIGSLAYGGLLLNRVLEAQSSQLIELNTAVEALTRANEDLNNQLVSVGSRMDTYESQSEQRLAQVLNDNNALKLNLNSINYNNAKKIDALNEKIAQQENLIRGLKMNGTISGGSDMDNLESSSLAIREELSLTAPLERLSIEGVKYNENLIALDNWTLVDVPINASPTPESGWNVGSSYVVNRSWISMTNVDPNQEEKLKGYDGQHGCYGAAFNAQFTASNRWNFDIGLAYNRLVNTSTIKDRFFFDNQYVSLDQRGEEIYETALNLGVPHGDYTTQIRFAVDDDMEQNCLIVEKINSRQTMDVLTLNLGTSYRLVDHEKFSLSLGAGLGLNRNINLKNEFDISIYLDGILRERLSDVTYELKGLNNFYGTFYGSLSGTYKVASRTHIKLDGVFNKGFTSIRDNWPSDSGPYTYLNSLNFQFGVRYDL